MHTLISSDWRLWLDPEHGVGWLGLQVRRGDDWLHIAPDCRAATGSSSRLAPSEGPAAGLLSAMNFFMLPYSNRIRDGKFSFEGKDIRLEEAESHSIHGALRKLPWQIENASDDRLLCRFSSTEHEQAGHPPVNWPWPIEAHLEHAVVERQLTSTISLTNKGSSSMPAGFGWHPYFLREVDGASPRLRFPVSGVFPDANGDCLPDGAPVALPADLDFRHDRDIDPAQHIDNCFAGLDGDIRITWPQAGLGLTMRADANCRFAILYNPDQPFFAVEPVTNANDAFNLENQGVDAGRVTLAQGDTLKATMTLELDG